MNTPQGLRLSTPIMKIKNCLPTTETASGKCVGIIIPAKDKEKIHEILTKHECFPIWDENNYLEISNIPCDPEDLPFGLCDHFPSKYLNNFI
jgi:hypothetical protein